MTLSPILSAATREYATEQERAADLALLKSFALRAVPVIEAAREAAPLLEREANLLRASCMIGDRPWACADCGGKNCNGRVEQEQMSGVSESLRTALAPFEGE